jgi:hypothetical protein
MDASDSEQGWIHKRIESLMSQDNNLTRTMNYHLHSNVVYKASAKHR